MKGEKPKMSVEEIKEVILRWETERLTSEQAIGKILLLIKKQNERLLKLESVASKSALVKS